MLWVGAARGILEPWGHEWLLQDVRQGQGDGGMCMSPPATGWSPESLLVPQCSHCICGPAAGLRLSMDVGVTL